MDNYDQITIYNSSRNFLNQFQKNTPFRVKHLESLDNCSG